MAPVSYLCLMNAELTVRIAAAALVLLIRLLNVPGQLLVLMDGASRLALQIVLAKFAAMMAAGVLVAHVRQVMCVMYPGNALPAHQTAAAKFAAMMAAGVLAVLVQVLIPHVTQPGNACVRVEPVQSIVHA